MEVGREETIKLDKYGGASGEEKGMPVDRSEGAVGLPLKEKKDLQLQELEKAVKNLNIDADPEEMSNLILELERAREKAIAEKRRAARVAWREKSRKKVRERSQFKERMVFMLPEEWELILKAVKDPKDKRVMSNMSLVWRTEMKRERTRYLFTEVFQILHGNKHLSGRDMLGYRVACQEWRDSVDLHLEREVKYEGRNVIVNLMKDWEYIARFREWCTQTYAADGNPFPSRKLMIGNFASDGDGIGNPMQMAGPYWREVELLLREWGGAVWEAVVVFDEGLNCNFRALCLNIQRFLRLMPNLRCFNIFCKDFSDPGWPGICRVTPTSHYVRDKIVAETYLPDMAYLKLLDVSFVPPALINALLGKYRSTLETVIVHSKANNPCEYGGGTVLPRLKTFVANGTFVPMEPLVITMDWTGLEEFVLTFHELAAAHLPQIFTIPNRFGGTLRSLSLDLQNKNGPLSKLDEKQLKKLCLDLPRVERFSLSVGRLNLKGLDFILPMAALKELSVTYHKLEKKPKKKTQPGVGSASSSTGNSGEIIKFSDYMNRLYESNIWSVLPDLREVTISVFKLKAPSAVPASMESIIAEMGEQRMPTKQKIYTREGYKNYLTSGSGSGEGGGDGTGSK